MNHPYHELEPGVGQEYSDTVDRLSNYDLDQRHEAFARLEARGIETVDFDAEDYIPFADNPDLENRASAVSHNSAPNYLKEANRQLYIKLLTKQKSQYKLLTGLGNYLIFESTMKRPFLTNVGQIEKYVYDDKRGYLLADENPTVGGGYLTGALMVTDMSKWAEECLNKKAYDLWHRRIVEQIKPDRWQPNHIDKFGAISRVYGSASGCSSLAL